jgi:hypothetical protein
MSHLEKPKLRYVTFHPTTHQGETYFVVQDSLKLIEGMILLPPGLGLLAMLCDGAHTLSEIAASLEVRYGLLLPPGLLENLINQLDQALLLEGATLEQAKQQALNDYRQSPFRRPALAGPSYPAEPTQLRKMLQTYLDRVNGVARTPADSRGIISPHIDYQRGGETYAQVWASAAEAVRQAELIIIFGTDHNGGYGTITLTRQHYASPLGVMPTDQALVNRLAEVLGPENAFADELHHRGEHSVELALVWLQYVRGETPCPIVPILCGTFHHFMTGQADIATENRFKAFTEVLRQEMAGRRTLVVAAGDLAHLGPAFDGPPLDTSAYNQMEEDDTVLMESLAEGNTAAFFKLMQDGQYQRNVCGLSPFYFTLNALGQTKGQTIAYDRCPADNNRTSFVSICGMVLE